MECAAACCVSSPAGAQDPAALSAAVAAMAGAPAGAGARATPQNWRAGVAAVSRSTALRRPVADVMAADALKLVKKWARDRCEELPLVLGGCDSNEFC
jgi:hypothetical protein